MKLAALLPVLTIVVAGALAVNYYWLSPHRKIRYARDWLETNGETLKD